MQSPVLVSVLPVQAVEHQLPVLGHLVKLDRVGGSALTSTVHQRRETPKSDVGKADSARSPSVWPGDGTDSDLRWMATCLIICDAYGLSLSILKIFTLLTH